MFFFRQLHCALAKKVSQLKDDQIDEKDANNAL